MNGPAIPSTCCRQNPKSNRQNCHRKSDRTPRGRWVPSKTIPFESTSDFDVILGKERPADCMVARERNVGARTECLAQIFGRHVPDGREVRRCVGPKQVTQIGLGPPVDETSAPSIMLKKSLWCSGPRVYVHRRISDRHGQRQWCKQFSTHAIVAAKRDGR